MEHTFGWPTKKIVAILASAEEPVPMDSIPGVKTYEVLDLRLTEAGFSKKTAWSIEGKIPSFAKAVIRPDMLKFNEETTWVNNTATFMTKLTPHFLTGKIECNIIVQFNNNGEGKTRRNADFSVKVGIPFIGKKMEQMIADILKNQNEQYAVRLNESFSEMLGQPVM